MEKVVDETEISKFISTEHEGNSKPISEHKESNKSVVETSKTTKFIEIIDESMSTSQATCTNTDRNVVIAEEVVCSPPRKQRKDFDEQIVMGEELTDIEINFAQHLLEQQVKHTNDQWILFYVATRKDVKCHK